MGKNEDAIQKILIDHEHKFYSRGKDVHTQFGYITQDALAQVKNGESVTTNKGKAFTALDPSFIDRFEKIKHGAQTIPLKDIGFIIAQTGMQSDWKILDAGAGSGALASFLAHLVPKGKVYTCEIRDDHAAIVEHNILFLGLSNLKLLKHDIYTGLPKPLEKLKGKFNLVTLDVPEPWRALESAHAALAPGGFLVSYSPCIPQVGDFAASVNERFIALGTFELIERSWEVIGRKIRPTAPRLHHSGFLTFLRKIKR